MLLSIIIVNYNTKRLTTDCLESIFKYLSNAISFEVIVVDNGSTDGSQEAFREFSAGRDNVPVIETGANLGFAKGNNIGIRKARGRQVLLLNSDTYLVDDSIIQAVRYLDERPDVFGCGCTLLNADGSVGISYGTFPELGVVCCELLTWGLLHLRARVPRRPSAVRAIDFPCGAFFLMKRELLDKVGELDERFFMYSEETDLAKRAKKAGYRIVHFGPARVVHLQGKSGAGNGNPPAQNTGAGDLTVVFYQSWRRYLKKHCSALDVALIGLLLSLFFKANNLIFGLLRRDKARAQYAKELRALRRGWSTAEEAQ
jgi:GT2 family glycosyltransferase